MKTIHNILESLGNLVILDNWNQMQNIVNKEIGWENMTLYAPFVNGSGRKQGNHIYMNINDPRQGDATYVGFKVKDKYVGFACIELDQKDVLYIGDFEVFEKRKGYGRQFFEAIVNKFPRKRAELCYHGMNAKQFWTHIGFVVSHGCVMQKDLK